MVLVLGVGAAAAAGFGTMHAPWLVLAVLSVVALLVVPVEWVLAATAIGSVAQAASVDVGGASIRLEQVAATVLAIRVLASRDRRALGGAEWALGAFFLVLLVSSLVSAPEPQSSLRATALIGFGAVSYLAVASGVVGPEALRRAVRMLLITGAVGATIGILAVASAAVAGTSWGITRLDIPAGFPSATGVAFEHNLYGSMCAMVAVAYLGLWRQGSSWFTPRGALAGFWIAFAGLLLSVTRGAWIGFLVALVVVVLIARPAPGRSLARLAVIGTVAAAILFTGAFVAGRGPQVAALTRAAVEGVEVQASRALEFQGATGYLRAREWSIALSETMSSDPIFGRGTASYGQVHFEQTRAGPVPAFLGNWVVRTFHDGGLAALTALVVFLLAVAWPDRRLLASGDEVSLATRALIGAAAVAAVAYLATDGLYFVWPWLVLGLIRAGRLTQREGALTSG